MNGELDCSLRTVMLEFLERRAKLDALAGAERTLLAFAARRRYTVSFVEVLKRGVSVKGSRQPTGEYSGLPWKVEDMTHREGAADAWSRRQLRFADRWTHCGAHCR